MNCEHKLCALKINFLNSIYYFFQSLLQIYGKEREINVFKCRDMNIK